MNKRTPQSWRFVFSNRTNSLIPINSPISQLGCCEEFRGPWQAMKPWGPSRMHQSITSTFSALFSPQEFSRNETIRKPGALPVAFQDFDFFVKKDNPCNINSDFLRPISRSPGKFINIQQENWEHLMIKNIFLMSARVLSEKIYGSLAAVSTRVQKSGQICGRNVEAGLSHQGRRRTHSRIPSRQGATAAHEPVTGRD